MKVNRSSGKLYRLYLLNTALFLGLLFDFEMEAICSLETSVVFRQLHGVSQKTELFPFNPV
jgi:hypothetical protein